MSLRTLILFLLTIISTGIASADDVDELEALLRDKPQVQEKIYIHTDNSAYFVGDTLWYKAYVVRADDLHPTDMSKLLYVELLSPDGIVVERQHIVIGSDNYTCGQFVLTDSLYSGYYEVRAYTRWQLNFNVTERHYNRNDRLKFYGKQAADDYFRDFEGLYSRVLPVYEKPKEAGVYTDRYMLKRPKQHVLKDKDRLFVTFFPEGGQLVQGLPATVAYEVRNSSGQALDMTGQLTDGREIKTEHMGRGRFTITPSTSQVSATFNYNGKDYSFKLPKAQPTGASLSFDEASRKARVESQGVKAAAWSVLCRGRLVEFGRLAGTSSETIDLSKCQCPTGVNEIIVYGEDASPLASRLFFVNNKDYGKTLDVSLASTSGEVGAKTTLMPYEPLDVNVRKGAGDNIGTFSIAIRDAQTDDHGYDDGNIMTDMLLSSELKGFIAYPAYYFASDDAKHRSDLDLLMMVQGWRRYSRAENIRYLPERGLTYEGTVLTVPSIADILELEDLEGVGEQTQNIADEMMAEALNNTDATSSDTGDTAESADASESTTTSEEEEIVYADTSDVMLGMGRVRKNVLVEAEINKDGQTAGTITRTDTNGRFLINLPPFYGKAILFAKAYSVKDSIDKCMGGKKADKDWLNERAFPDYFVKRDMIYPIFSAPYSWYQINSPELQFVDEDDDKAVPEDSKLAGNHTLQTVVVKAKRRGKRAIDWKKPAIVRDAYDIYNDVSDYGLSWGVVNFKQFPMAVATYFFGNMGRYNKFNVRAMIEGTSFYRNYTPSVNEYDKNAAKTAIFEKLRLNRMKDIRVFTDYELRTDSGDVQETNSAAVTLDFVPMPDDSKRYTYRDRRYILDGISYAEQFYCPDYSQATPAEPSDYRRTIYWNPNAKFNENGEFHVKAFNNCRETRVTVSAAGIGPDGQMYYR